MTRVAAVVLAAGRSSRFRAGGGAEKTKLVAKLDGKPIVRRVVEAALASRARPVVVVVGHARTEIEAALAGLPVTFANNPDFETGIASSLCAGLAATPCEAMGAIVLLGDMPNVSAELIDRLVDAQQARPTASAIMPMKDGGRGNPVLLARGLFDRAMRLRGDEGARRLLADLGPSEVVEVVAGESDVTFDIDTPADLAAARRTKHSAS